MPQLKDIAPYPTEGDDSSSPDSSGPVNNVPSRDATPATSAAQQSDNIAHALAGAGGGLLAMTLTYPSHHPLHSRPSRSLQIFRKGRQSALSSPRHHQTRRYTRSVRRPRFCALWYQRHELRVLLLVRVDTRVL